MSKLDWIKFVLIFCLPFMHGSNLYGQTKQSLAQFDSLLNLSISLQEKGKIDSALTISKQLDSFPKNLLTDDLRIKHIRNLSILLKDKEEAIALLDIEAVFF